MNIRKILTGGILLSALVTAGAFAQDSERKIEPDFTLQVETTAGSDNLSGNKSVESIPGVSASGLNSDLRLLIKGSFTRSSEWGVEKADGITRKDGIGYEAGMTLDIAKLNAIAKGDSAVTTGNSSYYSRIQSMIDWYERNRGRFSLPYNPCETTTGTPWPTTAYGSSSSRYQFIKGSTVEPGYNVKWTSKKWADAQALYNEIKNDIETKIDEMYTGDLSTGDVSQFTYAGLTSSQKEKAEKKQRALKEFKDIASGTTASSSVTDAVTEAFIKVTNILHAADFRFDFTGKTLSAGRLISSELAGTTKSGAAAELSVKNGLFPGLKASLSGGLAGGEKSTAENYDTDVLDYWPGIKSELAAKADVQYITFIEPFQSELTVQAQGIMTDMLVANKNFAADMYVGIQKYGVLSGGGNIEGMFINWRDRLDDDSDYDTSWSLAGGLNAGFMGAGIEGTAAYKTKGFEHITVKTTEDRFYGRTCDSDYSAANLEKAVKTRAAVSFNPEYFLGMNVITVKVGAEAFLYNDDLAVNGKGIFTEVKLPMKDLIDVPLELTGRLSYYKNSELREWSDYSSFDELKTIDYMTWSAGASFTPVRSFSMNASYTSSPSYSRIDSERISTLAFTGKITFGDK